MEYNDLQENLIVTNQADPIRIEILSLNGTVIQKIENEANGYKLFRSLVEYVALSNDKTIIYVPDFWEHSVTLLTLNGKVKAVFKDKTLLHPKGICVNRSGIVFVAGFSSNTVHQIVPGSDKLELLLDQNNGLQNPITINYCDFEDKLYVGQDGGFYGHQNVKIFKMK